MYPQCEHSMFACHSYCLNSSFILTSPPIPRSHKNNKVNCICQHSSCKSRSEHDAVASKKFAILCLLSSCGSVIPPIPFAIRTLLWHFGCFASPASPSVCWVSISRLTDLVTSKRHGCKAQSQHLDCSRSGLQVLPQWLLLLTRACNPCCTKLMLCTQAHLYWPLPSKQTWCFVPK